MGILDDFLSHMFESAGSGGLELVRKGKVVRLSCPETGIEMKLNYLSVAAATSGEQLLLKKLADMQHVKVEKMGTQVPMWPSSSKIVMNGD